MGPIKGIKATKNIQYSFLLALSLKSENCFKTLIYHSIITVWKIYNFMLKKVHQIKELILGI